MSCSIAEKTDKNRIKQLWERAFDEHDPFLSGYFDHFWDSSNAVIYKDESGEIRASLSLIPQNIRMRGKDILSSYIAGVNVEKKYRGRGLSKILMEAALREQIKRNEIFSALIPFKYSFYKKMGYCLSYSLLTTATTKDNLPHTVLSSDIKKISPKNYSELNCVYNDFCKNRNGYVIRTKKDWEYIFFDNTVSGGEIYGAYENGRLTGYISFCQSSKKAVIREFIYLTPTAYNSLISFSVSYFSSDKAIEIIMPPDDIFHHSLNEMRKTTTFKPYAMLRVTDIRLALDVFGMPDMKLGISDPLIAENNGTFKRIGSKIEKTDSRADAHMEISVFSQLLSGFVSSYELSRTGILSADDEIIKMLDSMYPKMNNFISHLME